MTDRDPEPLPYDEARAREVVGSYENDAMTLTIATDGAGLTLEVRIKPEVRAALDTELPPDYPPAAIGLLPGDGDEYIVTERRPEGAARLLHPRRERRGRGGRPRRPVVHPGSGGLAVNAAVR